MSSSSIYSGDGPENAVDGNLGTQLHTLRSSSEWFKMTFSGSCRVDEIVIVNGKLNYNYVRLNNARVYVTKGDTSHILCGKITTRRGESYENQTYRITCSLPANHIIGVGVMVRIGSYNFLEMKEIEVFGRCS